MGSSGSKLLLVLTLVLLVISATITTYITLSLQVASVATGSTASGVVSLNILGHGASSAPSKSTGVVSVEILEPEG
jgi:hypothetical protein